MLQQPTLAAILLLTLFSLSNSMEVRHRLVDLLSLAERNEKKQVVEGPSLFNLKEKSGVHKATTTTTSIIVDEETFGAATVRMTVATLTMVMMAVIAALFAVATATFVVKKVARASEYLNNEKKEERNKRRKRKRKERWSEQGCKERKMKLLVMLSCLMDLVRSVPIPDGGIQSAVNDWIAGDTKKDNVVATYGDIKEWDTSEITDMGGLFQSKSTFNEDISKWDVSQVTTMTGSTLDFHSHISHDHTFSSSPLSSPLK